MTGCICDDPLNNVTLNFDNHDGIAQVEIIGPFSLAPAENVWANPPEELFPTLLSNSGKLPSM